MNRAYSVIDIREMDDEQRIIRGIATSPTPDRLKDVVDQFGVKVADDIPLFLYHDSTKIVGRATFGKPNAKGIPFEARLPKITEPGALKERVDEAWAMVRHKLITAVSIGFRVLDDAYEVMKNGGLKYLKTEVLELSLVPVPAHPDALIEGFKSIGSDADKIIRSVIELRAASGPKQRGAVKLIQRNMPGASGPSPGDKPGTVKLFLRGNP